jgi:hypothetical protein
VEDEHPRAALSPELGHLVGDVLRAPPAVHLPAGRLEVRVDAAEGAVPEAPARADEEGRGDPEVELRFADALGEGEGVEVLEERPRRVLDDRAVRRAPREAADVREALAALERPAQLDDRELALVADDRVDRRERLEALAEGERRKVPAARDVAPVAGVAERARERAELLRAELERHRHADERRRMPFHRVEHVLRVLRAVEGGEARRVAGSFERRREVPQGEVLFDFGSDQKHLHDALPRGAAPARSRTACAARDENPRELFRWRCS